MSSSDTSFFCFNFAMSVFCLSECVSVLVGVGRGAGLCVAVRPGDFSWFSFFCFPFEMFFLLSVRDLNCGRRRLNDSGHVEVDVVVGFGSGVNMGVAAGVSAM